MKLSPKTKNERIGLCIASANNFLHNERACKMCGELPCPGVECVRERLYELEQEIADLRLDLGR